MKRHILATVVSAMSCLIGALYAGEAPASELKNYKDAADFGFLPENDGLKNADALQKAVEGGGTIAVFKKGTYAVSKTVMLDDNTRLVFGAGVSLKKVKADFPLAFLFVNRGAYDKKYNKNIRIEGLNLIVNGVDVDDPNIIGLRGHLSFFYVKDLRIENFRCYDLEKKEFCIHVCTFENILISDVIIRGMKDGIHLGRGKSFKISDCEFTTFDDAIALNAHDYSTSNPEVGWIEDGVVENITDLSQKNTTGYFCRILAGAWVDWREGMVVRRSDSVVSNGMVYRVVNKNIDGKTYVSKIRPTHKSGVKVLDGIYWAAVQEGAVYTAGVRNVVFRDIYLYKPRVAFSIHFDNDNWSRSYYPGADRVCQEGLVFDNVRVLHGKPLPFIASKTPIDVVVLKNCFLGKSKIVFTSNSEMKDFGKTFIRMYGCVYDFQGEYPVIVNNVKSKELDVFSSGTVMLGGKAAVSDASEKSVFNCDFLQNR